MCSPNCDRPPTLVIKLIKPHSANNGTPIPVTTTYFSCDDCAPYRLKDKKPFLEAGQRIQIMPLSAYLQEAGYRGRMPEVRG